MQDIQLTYEGYVQVNTDTRTWKQVLKLTGISLTLRVASWIKWTEGSVATLNRGEISQVLGTIISSSIGLHTATYVHLASWLRIVWITNKYTFPAMRTVHLDFYHNFACCTSPNDSPPRAYSDRF